MMRNLVDAHKVNRVKRALLTALLSGSLLLCVCAQAQGLVPPISQNAPLQLGASSIFVEDVNIDVSIGALNQNDRPVTHIAVGLVLVDAFNDVIMVRYVRWAGDFDPLAAGKDVALGDNFVEPRAADLFLSIPFVYAVRFEDGSVWKENLNHVTTELLSQFGVAVGSSVLQP